MIIELLIALIFTGLYALFFMIRPATIAAPMSGVWGWLAGIGSDWWFYSSPVLAWPSFVALVFLVAGLIAMTIIDARTFTIPIQIPVFVTIFAFIAYPVQALLPVSRRAIGLWPIQTLGWQGTMLCFGAMGGILIGLILLKMGKIRYSFHDYHEYVKEGETLGDYPHARREMFVELLYLLPCMIGAVVGWFVGGMIASPCPPLVVQALGGTVAGYLMGGGLIWGIRILASLGFGKEAMGLGDVHLMGAVGAVLGWFDPILIFFIAPFSGLIWYALSRGLSALLRKRWSELPYGPHLAIATLVVILCRPGLHQGWNALFGIMPWPETKLCVPPPPPAPTATPPTNTSSSTP